MVAEVIVDDVVRFESYPTILKHGILEIRVGGHGGGKGERG